MLAFAALTLAAALASPVAGQNGSAAVVRACGRVLGNGGAIVVARVDPGYHIYSHDVGRADLIPVALQVPGERGAHVTYPPGRALRLSDGETVRTYAGTVAFAISFSPRLASADGVAAALRVQACTEHLCLPPATLRIPLARSELSCAATAARHPSFARVAPSRRRRGRG